MKNIAYIFAVLVLLSCKAEGQSNFSAANFDTEDGGYIEASLFEAGKEKAVLFAHGGVFNKESWYFLAEQFQEKGISSLSIDFRGYGSSKSGNTDMKYYDILGAISYLREKGYGEISIIGGSMGGAAVLNALDRLTEPVARVALLAPAGGPPLLDEGTKKLFVVSEGDRFHDTVISVFNASAEPKRLSVFTGNAHAQHLLNSDHSEELQSLLLTYVSAN